MSERRDTRDDLRPVRDDAKPIRIVVVEDSPIQREALVDLFEEDPHLKVVAAVGTGREGIARIIELKPDEQGGPATVVDFHGTYDEYLASQGVA